MNNLRCVDFSTINLGDPFFDSLKADYKEFSQWFGKKIDAGEKAYAYYKPGKVIDGFLYVKPENGVVSDVVPPIKDGRHLKVGTMKINAHNTKLGQRFVKKIFDHAIELKVDDIYVTVFAKHDALIKILEKYGFQAHATKTGANGQEIVLLKDLKAVTGNPLLDYPRVNLASSGTPHLLAIYPKYHSKFLPDSILNNEPLDIVQDVSHANSIHKIYISGIAAAGKLVPGDVLLMYRTTDINGKAFFRSVATSVVVVEEARKISSFASKTGFLNYVRPYSVFSKEELELYYVEKKRHVLIKFTYNIALKRRIIRRDLLQIVGISPSPRWDFRKITKAQLEEIIELGEVNENYLIN